MKILIATATAGGGHLQAAIALEEAWKLKRPRDLIKRVDILDFTSRFYRKAYAEGYVRLADKTPELYAHAFRKTDNAPLVKKLTRFRRLGARLVARPFLKLVDTWNPDLVLCPHFLPIEALGSTRGKKGHAQPRLATIITDFEAHALWMEPAVDLYAVATDYTRSRLVARGVRPSKIVVTGIPVSQRFVKNMSRDIIRTKHGLSKKEPLLLVLGGGLGMGPLGETLRELDQATDRFQVIVVAGRNEALRKALSRKRYQHPVRVLGFVDHMEELMAMADLIVTKPGGLTTSEALASGRPLLIVNPLPGQEAANSDYLLEHGAAVKVNRLEDLPYRISSLLRQGHLRSLARAAKRLGRPRAAEHIVQAVLRLFSVALLLVSVSFSTFAAESVKESEDATVLRYRTGLQDVLRFTESRPDLFPAESLRKPRLLTRADKEAAWSAWSRFLEYVVALDALQTSHKALPRLGHPEDYPAFLIRYAAFISAYRWSLELLHVLDHDRGFKPILNEPVPEIGLPKDTYDHLKFRFLNMVPASRFAALKTIGQSAKSAASPELKAAIEEDEAALWRMGLGRGQLLTAKNALNVVQRAGFTMWFPVQTGVSTWMGDTRVWRNEIALIKPDQIESMRVQLEPGDILLERREWYLSNVGLPGYWPHAALYVGTPEIRQAYFGKRMEKQLKKQFPKAYADSLVLESGHHPVVLEAMSEGVVFTTLEHSGAADSLVILRPRATKQEKARALERAFHYAGRPYDFNFDFATDSSIVCSELVYKAYEPATDMKGVRFAWETLLGRQVASPNRMVQQFDEEYGQPTQQLDMILFLDGNEKSGRAYSASIEEFRRSWRRPKWHIWIQKEPV